MDGFKNTTKTMRMQEGGSCYAKGGKVSKAKVATVMHEWGKGDLHSGSAKGPKVSNQKQAVAIALSEGRKAAKPVHKTNGGETKPVGRDAKVGKATGYPMEGGKFEAVGAPIKKATGGYLKNAPSDSIHEAHQMVRSNPDLAVRAERLNDLGQIRKALALKPDVESRPSLVGLKKGGKVMRKADGGPIMAPQTPGAITVAPEASVMRNPAVAKAVVRKVVADSLARKMKQPMGKPGFNATPMIGAPAPTATPMGLKKGGAATRGC